MDIAWFPNYIAQNGQPVIAAMITALQNRSHRIVQDSLSADAAVIWSVLWAGRMLYNRKIFDHYRSQNLPVIVLEVGCLNRGHLWKVGVNGVSPRDRLAQQGNPGRSAALNLSLKPWRSSRGDHIVICLQRTQSMQWQGMTSAEHWLNTVIDEIRIYSDRPITVRPHPRQRLYQVPPNCNLEIPMKNPGTYDDFDFEKTLNRAWAVVNHNSHPGIQSIIQGVPSFVHQSSLAAPVANLDFSCIERPSMPSRDQWFEDLVWTEFTVDEIAKGLPLENLHLS